MTRPLVSILLPTYSRYAGGYLEQAVKSVLRQTFRDFELIIIDDASIDGSKGLIERYVKADRRVRTIRLVQNVGLPALTTYYGFRKARGALIAFAFDDCLLYPHHLETLVSRISADGNLGMVYAQAYIADSGGKRLIGSPLQMTEMNRANNHIPHVATLVRRGVFNRVGWFDPHFLLCRFYDWDMWRRIARQFPVAFVPKAVAEEFGTGLGDSFGRTYTLNRELMLKYAAHNRNALLLPANMHRYSPYRLDLPFSPEEKRELMALALEHFVLRHDAERIISLAAGWQHRLNAPGTALRWSQLKARNPQMDEPSLRLMHGLSEYARWKADKLAREAERMRSLYLRQHAFSQQQRHFIDSREAYIQQLLTMIQQLQRMLGG